MAEPSPHLPDDERPAGEKPVASIIGFPCANKPLDFDVQAGDIVLLRGRNGSGKTSLLRALAGLPAPLEPKSVVVQGTPPSSLLAKQLRARLQFAPQEPRDGLAGLTVRGEFRLRGLDLAASVASLSERDVATLSSGEARRVALAVAGARTIPLLLLDEPAEGLDKDGQLILQDLVTTFARGGAVVAADHSGLLTDAATRFVNLSPVIEEALAPIPSPGGPDLLSSDPTTRRRGDRDLALPGITLPAGFHVVTGVNGSGKSTLLLYLAGLLGPHGVRLRGQPHETGASIRLLLPRAGDLWREESVAAELQGVDPAIARLLLPPDLQARHPLNLSAGEAQRVALVKTLGQPAAVYLLDEPEAHLDGAGRLALRDALAYRVASGACLLAATHDVDLLGIAASTVQMGAP